MALVAISIHTIHPPSLPTGFTACGGTVLNAPFQHECRAAAEFRQRRLRGIRRFHLLKNLEQAPALAFVTLGFLDAFALESSHNP
ncbi:hypothetical protein [Geitlerinema calcuttense]|uniref:Uncharacterized protein n=1 Tax=Geitlerinema calcuttense NRMC-F 0142 TaxID=2922238 RepID=A0ABT7M4B3_9CYAN|nr:hypothetical protein [Geitlerinema calcuttense]MDL5057886.1 hypothetical protein [Geitlerinema calcuttense NRMC-F 0142]